MQPIAVQSSTLAAVSYDEARNGLWLEFRTRSVYQYDGVPLDIYQALLQAPSKGRYFNQWIRGRFPYRLLSKATEARSL